MLNVKKVLLKVNTVNSRYINLLQHKDCFEKYPSKTHSACFFLKLCW